MDMGFFLRSILGPPNYKKAPCVHCMLTIAHMLNRVSQLPDFPKKPTSVILSNLAYMTDSNIATALSFAGYGAPKWVPDAMQCSSIAELAVWDVGSGFGVQDLADFRD